MRLTIVQLIKRLFWKVKLQLSQLMYCNVGRGEKLQSCHSCKCVCVRVYACARVCVSCSKTVYANSALISSFVPFLETLPFKLAASNQHSVLLNINSFFVVCDLMGLE